MIYLSLLGETKAFPITRAGCEFIRPVRAKFLTLWKRLVCQKSGVQKLSYPRLDLCLVKSFLFSSMAYGLGKSHLSTTLRYLRFFPFHRQVMFLSSRLGTEEDHRETEKIVVDTCCHILLLSISTLRISGRDSCKEGRLVTAQNCEPKFVNKIFTFYCFLASWHPH